MEMMNKEVWQSGYDAGHSGESSVPPKNVDGLAWSSGYIEGSAKRDVDADDEDHGPRL